MKKFLNRFRKSLTARIFLITSLLLSIACSITYCFIAWATPISYVSVVSEATDTETKKLLAELEQTPEEHCAPVIEAFIRKTHASLLIEDSDGNTLTIGDSITAPDRSKDSAQDTAVLSEDLISSGSFIASADSMDLIHPADSGYFSDSVSESVMILQESRIFSFSFAGSNEVYTLTVLPDVMEVNQTSEALVRVLPALIPLILLFSLLSAVIYSRYITRPIVQLSELSGQMADLDFDRKYTGHRADEIGSLGRNLNHLSARLSDALCGLQDANEALKQDIERERELERQRLAFFSAASHELKTPVTILKGQLAGMLDGIDIYRDRDTYLAKSLRVTDRMEALIQDILTISRMETADFALHPKLFDLSELAVRQLSMTEDFIAYRKLRLSTDLSENAMLYADPIWIQKVVENLLSNAFFYAPAGATIKVRTMTCGSGITLIIENSGSHIPEESLPHLFEPFYRADNSRNRRTGGSGLGLYLVRMILEKHHAGYQIENTPDGVRFTVHFCV